MTFDNQQNMERLRAVGSAVSSIKDKTWMRLYLEEKAIPVSNIPVGGVDQPDPLKVFTRQARNGFRLLTNTDEINHFVYDQDRMIAAIGKPDVPKADDDLGIYKPPTEIVLVGVTPLAALAATSITMRDLIRQGNVTLGSLDLANMNELPIPGARNHPYCWSMAFNPEAIWGMIGRLESWTTMALNQRGSLIRSDAEKVVAATQFFGWADHLLSKMTTMAKN